MSSANPDKLDCVVRALISDRESTTIKANEDEDPFEVIPEDDDDNSLAAMYVPPNEASSVTSVQVDLDWLQIYAENRFCIKGPKFFAFPEGYELLFPADESRVKHCPTGNVAIYAHMLDFDLRLPLDPFIVKIFQAWNIWLLQLTPLERRNLISYAYTIRYKKFRETVNMFRKLHWLE